MIYNGWLHMLDLKDIRRYAGIRAGTDFPEEHIVAAAQEILAIAAPKGCYEFFDYDSHRGVLLDEQRTAILRLEGSGVRVHLVKATQVAFMAVTIGEGLEYAISKHFKDGEYAQGLLLDAAATTAVEMIADQMDEYIRELVAKRGCITLGRFSPGYGNWPLEQQSIFAQLLELADIGVTVTDRSMLSPRKSVTAVIGILPGKNTGKRSRSCSTCKKIDCEARKE